MLSLPDRVFRLRPALPWLLFEDRLTNGPRCGYTLFLADSAERERIRLGCPLMGLAALSRPLLSLAYGDGLECTALPATELVFLVLNLFPAMSFVEAFSFFFTDLARVCLIFPLLLTGLLSCAMVGVANRKTSTNAIHFALEIRE